MLNLTNKLDVVLKEFNDITDCNQKVLYMEQLLKEYNLIPNLKIFTERKDQVIAEKYRNAGNEYFKKKQMQEALEKYNERYDQKPLVASFLLI